MQSKGDSKPKGSSALDKATILTRISWARHVLGLLAGLACGILGITGFVGVAIFAASNILLVLVYYSYILGVDPEEHGGHGTFTNESLMPGLAIFVVRTRLASLSLL